MAKYVKITGTKLDDFDLMGTSQADNIKGKDGNDTILGGLGNDKIDGGKGIDTAILNGLWNSYTITKTGNGKNDHFITTGQDGVDSYKNIERLQFDDGTLDVATGVFTAFPPAFNDIDVVHVGTGGVGQVLPTLSDGSTPYVEVRNGSISIETMPGSGDPAIRLQTFGDSGRLRLGVNYDTDSQFKLGDLNELSFDYLIASSSRTDVIPTMRVKIDADGDLTTTADQGALVFEWAYQGLGSTTTGTEQSVDFVGGNWGAWQRASGQNFDQVANVRPLSDWADADGFTPLGGITFDEDSLVIGFELALGSGNGTATMYVNNLNVGGVSYDILG